MSMTKLMFMFLKQASKCSELDQFVFDDWLVFLKNLKEIIPDFKSLSSIEVSPIEENPNSI